MRNSKHFISALSSGKRAFSLLLAVVMLLTLCSCSVISLPPQEQTSSSESEVSEPEVITDCPISLSGLIEQLNSVRFSRSADDRDMKSFLPDYTSEDFLADELTDEEFALLTAEPPSKVFAVSHDEAVQDVEYLFRILRTSYGAYTFFGGDEAFGKAKAEILSELNIRYPERIGKDGLRTLIIEKLGFIEDSHFAIDGYSLAFEERYYYRDANFLKFRRDSHGYYAFPRNDSANNRRWYISPEDEELLYLTIAEDGELVYGIFTLATPFEELSLNDYIVLTSAEGDRAGYTIEWKIVSDPAYNFSKPIYAKGEANGIPTVSLRSFYLDDSRFDAINSYLNDAAELRDEPILIVDLSGNLGGYDTISSMWLYSLTGGDKVGVGVGYSSYISRLNDYVLSNNKEEVTQIFDSLDFFKEYPDYWDILDNGTESGVEQDYTAFEPYIVERETDFIEQDRTIFAVLDKNTFSAGEMALFQLENMSNVVFVGVNSNGCLLTGGTNIDAPVYLPNSGISVIYSIIIVTNDRMENFDSYGFRPDIIVNPESAPELIVKCLDYYNYNN